MNWREIHNMMYREDQSGIVDDIFYWNRGERVLLSRYFACFSRFPMIMFCQRALDLFDQFRLDRALASRPWPSQLIEQTINRPITSIMPFSGAPILNAAGHRMCVWHVPAYAVAQLCFKLSALRSRQCGCKTQYWLEFWSLDLPSSSSCFWA